MVAAAYSQRKIAHDPLGTLLLPLPPAVQHLLSVRMAEPAVWALIYGCLWVSSRKLHAWFSIKPTQSAENNRVEEISVIMCLELIFKQNFLLFSIPGFSAQNLYLFLHIF